MIKGKHILLITIFYFLTTRLNSQNLVLNHSFEDNYNLEYDFIHNIDTIIANWHSIRVDGYANYFHKNALNSLMKIPNNFAGNQDLCDSNAYIGEYVFSSNPLNLNSSVREYVTGELITPLFVNKCYKVSFKYSLAETHSHVAISNLGIYFSDSIPINNSTIYPSNNLNYQPQIEINQILNDRVNWVIIERYFIASGGEQYFTLGNFNNNESTNLTFVKNGTNSIGGQSSYIYLDDIVVEEVPLQTLPQLNLGADTIMCKGEELTFSDLLPDSTVYVWNQLSNDTAFTIDSSGTYILEAYNGCSNTTDTINVEFVEPKVELGNDILACKREEIILQNQNETTNHPQAEFSWLKETEQLSTNQLINITEEGIYSLTANIGHCVDSDTIEVDYETPTNSIFQIQNLDTTFCVSGILDASSTVWNETYLWNTQEETQTIEVTETGTYSVYTENECTEATSTFNVKVEQLEEGVNNYNIITPNNDFVNDLFTIYEGNSEVYQIQIYNRWGKLVWQSDDPTNHWDGKSGVIQSATKILPDSEGVSDGTYFYHLSFRNCAGETVEKKGAVNVIR